MLLITGSNGQLGQCLGRVFPNALFAGRDILDITDEEFVCDFISRNHIDTIINCAAYTAVDKAEENCQTAKKINEIGVRNLAESFARIIHISTDYVFDGKKSSPYLETDKASPLSVYGKTKLAGEKVLLREATTAVILRVGWLYSPYGNNFVKTIRRLASERKDLGVLFDQTGTPTSALDLADLIKNILPKIKEGNREIYHFSNEGVASWYDFARKICEKSKLVCNVFPIEGKDYPQKAKRPSYSVMNKSKIKRDFGISISHWEEALELCIKQF